MPGFVQKGLQRFNHANPSRPQHSPHPWTPPTYGQATQYAKALAVNPILTKEQQTYCQQVIGYFLYYGCAIANTILAAVGSIATALSTATWPELQSRLNHLLDYLATHPSAKIKYDASQMHLRVHTDSSYLNEPTARSRGAGFFYLSNKPFLNAKNTCEHRLTLEALGHPQGPTPLHPSIPLRTPAKASDLRPQELESLDLWSCFDSSRMLKADGYAEPSHPIPRPFFS